MSSPSRVLVACEFSGVVREAFRRRGHDAWSADLLDAADGSPYHFKGDARERLGDGWDLLIAHPPCTRLSKAGSHWLHSRGLWAELDEAANLFLDFLNAPIEKVAVENPVMHQHALERIGRGPNFAVQPWQFGHNESKWTCFWTKGLPVLQPTRTVESNGSYTDSVTGRYRSVSFQGIAEAMADQWVGPVDQLAPEPLGARKASRFKGVTAGVGDRWKVQVKHQGQVVARGPYHFEEEAHFALQVVEKALKEGTEVPSTAQIRALMPDLSAGRERPLTMRERRRL